MKVETENMNVSFVTNMQSKRTFAAFAKMKSNIKTKPAPSVTRDDLVYFVHDFRRELQGLDVMNIDLKSAYAHCLYIDGYITKETYAYIKRLNKPERLAAVGMLASRKEKYNFKKGLPDFEGEQISEFAPFFFHAVKRTYSIMTDLRRIIGKRYLFTWVDGIYFLPDAETLVECDEYLRALKFPYTTEYLNDFNVRINDRKIFVSFNKDRDVKTFNIPILPSTVLKSVHDAILRNGGKNGNSINSHKIKKQ